MSFAVWLGVTAVWMVVFGGVGALLASLVDVDPVVGVALSVVLGPIGWLGIPVVRRFGGLDPSAESPAPVINLIGVPRASGRQL